MADSETNSRLKSRGKGPLVLLFYDGFERYARPGVGGQIYSQSRRFARWAWRNVKRAQVRTGFYVAFLGLKRALEAVGADVRVNDFALARAMPNYPIGIAGYPTIFDRVRTLPNPMIFGPGDFGPPRTMPQMLADNPNIELYTQPSAWIRDYYGPEYKDKIKVMFAAIDTDRWPDFSQNPKDNDVLIYDKIRWRREALVPALRERLIKHLEARGLSYQVLVIGAHHSNDFADGLKRSRALAFLCEHETQGLAYQEAMATNTPVFAWDEGKIGDPSLTNQPGLAVSSVPYFDARCGTKFKLDELEPRFDEFWERCDGFRPREYVLENLSFERCAENYLILYQSIAR
jgi:glycosyltransferase involved in cell wall biosynthesis